MMTLQQNFKNTFQMKQLLLDVYNSWGKFGTIGVASKTGIIYLPYIKKIIKKILKTIDLFHF